MKKKYLIIFGIIVVISILIVYSWMILRQDRNVDRDYHNCGYAQIDWINCIYIDTATFTKNDSNPIVSENEIDKEIGVVKSQLAGSIHDIGYTMKSWDATVLGENTKIFSIKNDEHSIAALVDGIYLRYSL